ncbi:glycoside hydrolase [Longibacter salinarum]|uniref:Glycoside hydrolase n=1 Tax=Longibacter salinarum TaxID=1850348 RepID=A0A2A8D0Q7_9BACT|nr:glycosyl hydrolase-related protein [Longibacter salinarum]PEN14238.1 glycoside hydrolase [Longibacter salinarum]
MDAPLHGIVVSHTHWDRAWYLPFQVFRHRLVRLVDRLIELLETNEEYRAFTLDGQTVLLDDYLEIRPDQEERLRTLIDEGRLLIGPWYTLPDLFLVSAESVVRNLQVGRAHCDEFGGGMTVGYIPDPFGHFAQMPQILRGFGMQTYIFMRGLGREEKERLGGTFDWRAPDGSTVRAIYQPQGYFPAGNLGHPEVYGRFDGHTPTVDLAEERVREAVETLSDVQQEKTLLLSNGFDHMPEQPELPDLLTSLNKRMTDVDLEHGTLPQFVDLLLAEYGTHETYEGDLVGNADHPILLNVYSTRIYLKQQNHRAQSLLTRHVEPMSAWLETESVGPDARPFLDQAWRLLLRNHPHDDICGCSVDAVHDDDEQRFRQIDEIGTSLLREHLESLVLSGGFEEPQGNEEWPSDDRLDEGAPDLGTTDVFVFNPHPFAHRQRVEATIMMPEPEGTRSDDPRPARPLAGLMPDGTPVDIQTLETEGDVVRSNYLEATWGRRYRVSFDVELPPLGYQVVRIAETLQAIEDKNDPAEVLLENDAYRVWVEGERLQILEKETGTRFGDALGFEYHLDAGDTYSYGPVPDHGPWNAEFVSSQHHPDRRETLQLQYALAVPEQYDRDAEQPIGTTTLDLTVDITLTLQQAVGISVRYENTARDGRLRIVLPTGLIRDESLADGHFALRPRKKPPWLTPEDEPERHDGYPGELNYPTQHQGDFVMVEQTSDDSDQGRRTWIANRGLPEYELLTDGEQAQVAVTLHRAVGWLSVADGRIRGCQAGPTVPTPGAQCQREMHAELAWGHGIIPRFEAVRRARAFAHPARATEIPYLPYAESRGRWSRSRSIARIDNPAIDLTALRPSVTDDAQAIRLCNLSADEQTARLSIGLQVEEWCVSTLQEGWDEASVRDVNRGTIDITVGPHEVVTLLLR